MHENRNFITIYNLGSYTLCSATAYARRGILIFYFLTFLIKMNRIQIIEMNKTSTSADQITKPIDGLKGLKLSKKIIDIINY